MNYFAHTATKPDGTPDPDRSHWQPLATHLRNVADLAQSFATPLGLAAEAELAPNGVARATRRAKLSRCILEQVFAECAAKNRQPGPDDCTDALQREILQDHGEKASRLEEIFQAEKDADYPQVAKLCRIIDAATKTVVVESKLIQRLENPDRSRWPDWREMMLGSVQLWTGKEREFALPELRGLPGVFRWNLEYNPFLGYMAGVLPLLKAGKSGFEPL